MPFMTAAGGGLSAGGGALLSGLLGLGSGLASPSPVGTEFKPFGRIPVGSRSNPGGQRNLTPAQILGLALSNVAEVGGALTERAGAPITLRGAQVQQPPTFTGGGLPSPIGLTGRDPALDDPDLLTQLGVTLGDPFLPGGSPRRTEEPEPHPDAVPDPIGGPPRIPPDPNKQDEEDNTDPSPFRAKDSTLMQSQAPVRPMLTPDAAQGGPADPFGEALGAAQLLLTARSAVPQLIQRGASQ